MKEGRRSPITTGPLAYLSMDELEDLQRDAYLYHRFIDTGGSLFGCYIEHESTCPKAERPRLVSAVQCNCNCRVMVRSGTYDNTQTYEVACKYSDFLTKSKWRTRPNRSQLTPVSIES
jgi:hypothetical protein